MLAFDSLGYAKRLRDGGVPQEQAEAHAIAAREFIMLELVTKAEFDEGLARLRSDIDSRLHLFEARMDARMDQRFSGFDQRFSGFDQRFEMFDQRLKHLEENIMLKMTVRFGAMLVALLVAIGGLLRWML